MFLFEQKQIKRNSKYVGTLNSDYYLFKNYPERRGSLCRQIGPPRKLLISDSKLSVLTVKTHNTSNLFCPTDSDYALDWIQLGVSDCMIHTGTSRRLRRLFQSNWLRTAAQIAGDVDSSPTKSIFFSQQHTCVLTLGHHYTTFQPILVSF